MDMGRVAAFICILGTFHVVQGQVGYIYNRPNDPINEGTIATLPVSIGVQPATTKSPEEVLVELGRAENTVDGFSGEHPRVQTFGNQGYHTEKTSFPGGYQENSRPRAGPEHSASPGYSPVHSDNSLTQTSSVNLGQPVSTELSEKPRPQEYYETVDSFSPPGTKTQGQPPLIHGSQGESNGFDGNRVQNTYSTSLSDSQNHGLTTPDQAISKDANLLSPVQFGTFTKDVVEPNSISTSQLEGLSHTTFSTFSTGQSAGDLGFSRGGGNDSDDGSYEGGDYSAIPGEPGIDYPIFSDIPQTSFKCGEQQWPGYYADIEARCQVFHICINNTSYEFLCPNGTVFSQEYFVCVWWNQFECSNAPNFFYLNEKIYDYTIMGSQLAGFPGVVTPGITGNAPAGEPVELNTALLAQNTPSVQPNGPSGLFSSFQPSPAPHMAGGALGPTQPLSKPAPQGPSGSFESFVVPQGPSTSLQPSAGPSGPASTFGSTGSFHGPSGQLESTAVPRGPSTSLQPSEGFLGPTVPFGSIGTHHGASGRFESTAVQGPSTSSQPSRGTSGPATSFVSTASFPGSHGPFESSTTPQRPTTPFYPSTGPFSQNRASGHSNEAVGTTGSFVPNAPLSQSNELIGPSLYESTTGPQSPTAAFGSTGTFHQTSTNNNNQNGPLEQSNGPSRAGATPGPPTPFQPSSAPLKPTGLYSTDSFFSTSSSQGLSGSFKSPTVPHEPSTSFQPPSGPNDNTAQSYGPNISFEPNASLGQSNEPFVPPIHHELSSEAGGSTGSFGSAEAVHVPRGPSTSFSGSSGLAQSTTAPEKSISHQPSTGPYRYNAPLGPSLGLVRPTTINEPNPSLGHPNTPVQPSVTFGPNVPSVQTNGIFGPSGHHEFASDIQGPSFDSAQTARGQKGSLGSPVEPSTSFQPSSIPNSENVLSRHSDEPTGSFAPNGPLPQSNGLYIQNESSSGEQGPVTSFGSVETSQSSGNPTASIGSSGSFETFTEPQKSSTPLQIPTGSYNYMAPLGQSIGPIRPATSFGLDAGHHSKGPATIFGSNSPFQPSNDPSTFPQPPTRLQTFDSPSGQNTVPGGTNEPLLVTSFQPSAASQGPADHNGHTELLGLTPISQTPHGLYEPTTVSKEPTPSAGPQTPTGFNTLTGYAPEVPPLSDSSRTQGTFKPQADYSKPQHGSLLDTNRPGEQTFVSQDQQGSHGLFGQQTSRNPNGSGNQPTSLQSGTPDLKLNNEYLPPYRHGS